MATIYTNTIMAINEDTPVKIYGKGMISIGDALGWHLIINVEEARALRAILSNAILDAEAKASA